MRRHSLSNVARGADAICFFQWRASRAGAEKYHSAMLPHAGPSSRVFTEICALGKDLQSLGEVATSTVTAEVAILFDWPSWWASELDSHPSQQFSYHQTVLAHYAAFWRLGVTCDVVPIDTDLSGYRIVVVPALYMVDDATAERIADVTVRGGTVVITYFSGIVDTADHIRLGGYPGAFRDLLGISVEEFGPLPAGQGVTLDDGSVATRWTEDLTCTDATAVLRYVDGPFPGRPAVTRRDLPAGGSAWYLATQLAPAGLATIINQICVETGVQPVVTAAGAVEAVRRSHADGPGYLFLINHGGTAAQVAATGVDILTGQNHLSGSVPVPAGGVVVLREDRPRRSGSSADVICAIVIGPVDSVERCAQPVAAGRVECADPGDATEQVRPKVAGVPACLPPPGHCTTQSCRIAFSRSNSRRWTLVVSLTTIPVTTCRCTVPPLPGLRRIHLETRVPDDPDSTPCTSERDRAASSGPPEKVRSSA